MPVTVTLSAITAIPGRPPWTRLRGTIQEVLDQLQNENITAANVVFYTDDNTNATAVFCRER